MHLKNVSLSFGTQTIFDDVSIYIPTNSKVGVVGVNGAGKSTLFNLLMKKLDPEAGKINYENEDRISFLPQVITATLTDKDITVYDYLESARPIKELESCLQKTYTRISTHPKEEQKLYQQIIKIERELSYWEQYSADNTLLEIITGLNIDGDMLNQKMLELSGGQKSKVAFAHLLYSKPEIMLLDEPTNHLDEMTKDFVQNYLKNYHGTCLIISHDINFLNNLVDKILYIDKMTHKIELYNGNYTYFLKVHKARETALLKQAEKETIEEQKLQAIVNKYATSSGKRKKMAQDREKKLLKLQATKTVVAPKQKDMFLAMTINRESNNIPLEVNNLCFKYDKSSKKNIINNLSFSLLRGEKFLVVGENGVGKSTLIKLINNLLTPDSGSIKLGNKTDLGYYAQEHELLDNNKTILENFSSPNYNAKTIRTILGQFLFYGDDVFKKVSVLSPGERSRVALAKLSLLGANFLLLDEPTNHLDPETQQIIANTFKTFPGTMLVVSHNPDFVDNLGISRILFLPSGKIAYYDRKTVEYYQNLNTSKKD